MSERADIEKIMILAELGSPASWLLLWESDTFTFFQPGISRVVDPVDPRLLVLSGPEEFNKTQYQAGAGLCSDMIALPPA